MKGNRVLGKGLSALIPGADELGPAGGEMIRRIPVTAIGFNPGQPRKVFAEDKLEELAASIRQVGVLQPVLVRRLEIDEAARFRRDWIPSDPSDHPDRPDRSGAGGEELPAYCVVAGERRVRAARLAGLDEVPALICTYQETEALKVALLENLQREDLGPLEEAAALQELISAYGATQEELAAMLGKSRSSVANTLRLLVLEPDIRELLQQGTLSRGHAKALLGLEAGPARLRLARLCVSHGLSVRDVERRVQAVLGAGVSARRRGRRRVGRSSTGETPALRELRVRAERVLGTPVAIEQDHRSGTGTIKVKFFDNNDLERLLALCGVDVDLS